jgi:hypothetical protein
MCIPVTATMIIKLFTVALIMLLADAVSQVHRRVRAVCRSVLAAVVAIVEYLLLGRP